MWLITMVWRDVTRRPARSLLTVLGLAVAVSTVVSLVGISTGFERSYTELYSRRNVDLVVQRRGGAERLNSGLDARLADRLRALPGVQSVEGGLVDMISFPDFDLFTVFVQGWEPNTPMYDRLNLLEGRWLDRRDRRGVAMGRVLAANLGKKLGDTVELYTEKFEIVAIFESTNVYENSYVIMLLGELQRLTDRPNQVSGFLVQTDRPGDKAYAAELRRKIEELDDLSATPPSEFVRGIQQLRLARGTAWVTSTIALLIGAIGVLNTMVMSVYERVKEIGTLRAIGWRKSRVVRMILLESTLLSVAGAALGTLGGVLLAHLLSKLPTTAGLIQGDVPWLVILQGFAVALLVGVAGALYPAIWGANLAPVEALRKK